MGARLLLAIGLIASLGGCGLKPLYQGGASGVAAQRLAGVEIAPIPGKAGWLVRNALAERLDATAGGAPKYRLTVELDDRIEGLGVRANDNMTRERRTVRARFQLREIAADPKAAPLLDETTSSNVGLDVTSSEYATVAAEDTALERLAGIIADRIIGRVAIDATRGQ
ncbi:LPS assembly lipoprotein LptE [Sphingobium sufflavum]|uniref:LPS assembly lipoprotein LptE n=1 Tax=Sphingobium sufflavum TaxID=1129547 RepID=UPI001F21984A|nr:LPS assembly lipoprotein LptE [Sphingobium sufflavum]MCE7795050.1 LPS assembly lipoprotein LptE [Sphingobium sufflavum]